jgi:hypothetical protein
MLVILPVMADSNGEDVESTYCGYFNDGGAESLVSHKPRPDSPAVGSAYFC